MGRLVLLLTLGFLGFIVVLGVLSYRWESEHEELARKLCNAIPVGTSTAIAKERAREMAKAVPEIEIKELSINLVYLNPYSPGDRVYCEANIFNDKIFNNTVGVNH